MGKPEIAFIDDEMINRKLWETQIDDAVVTTYKSPEDFWNRVDISKLNRFACIITDYYLKYESCEHFVMNIKKMFNGPVFICSDASDIDVPDQIYNDRVPKDPRSWRFLQDFVGKKRMKQ